ncbi:hypothetical protein GCM10027059_23830 [Myceligenerans halotolerans]
MMTTTSPRVGEGLWRRVLLGAGAIALYSIAAAALATLAPGAAWPAVGDSQYSSQQATIVPAMNVFALATLLLAVVTPMTTRAVQAVGGLVAAILAAVTGPLLAVVETRADISLLTPAAIALALTGTAISLARTWATERWAPSTREPATPH